MDPRVRFGQNLREHRARRGLSQEALAEKCGLHRTYVSSVERGVRNVALLNIARFAGALDCRPAELLDGVESLGSKVPD
ncbi:MAG: helix-turn-helix domain-containing protein [Dehalococcoidia bacterium]